MRDNAKQQRNPPESSEKGKPGGQHKKEKHCYHWFTITGLANISHSEERGRPRPSSPAGPDGYRWLGQGWQGRDRSPPPTVSKGQPEPYVASWLSKAAAFLGAFPKGIGIALFPRQGHSYELDPTECGRRLPTMPSAPPLPVSASTSAMVTISRYWPLLGHFSWGLPSLSASQLCHLLTVWPEAHRFTCCASVSTSLN